MSKINKNKQIEIEAATFRKLLEHLRAHTEVQNIDLMNLANFCRNCLSKWYKSAAEDRGVKIDYESARQIIYDMPYSDWKKKYQTEASLEKKEKFNSKKSSN
tara:strand:+ start:271 stop:576 length:306 start_codon:yes stop_codon:yes gene_type:complete